MHEAINTDTKIGSLAVARDREALKWHGLFYANNPTPSGCDRPVLRRSTTHGFESADEALSQIKKSFTAEQLERIDIPDPTPPTEDKTDG